MYKGQHQYDTRYKDSRVGEVQLDTETYETQPTHEMEVITINNIETRPEETPHVEQEVEVRVDNQPRQTEGVTQSGETAFQEWMRRMMESLKEDNRTLKEDSLKNNKKMEETLNRNNNSLNKNIESISKNMESLKEDLNKRIDNTHRAMDTLNNKIEDGSRALREELNTCLLYTSRCV